jgi:AcrR family transcriptional regulator
VLTVAMELADEHGLEKLTMRRLAERLGVEAMTLYYHVANKDDILDGILDRVIDEIELPPPGSDWKPALRRLAISAHETYMRHPWAAGLTLSPARLRPARLRYMDALLASLRQGGFSAEMTHHAYHAIESHIVGFTLWVVGITTGIADLGDGGATLFAEIARQPYPYLIEHMEVHQAIDSSDGAGDEGEFEFGLDLLLDGLERTLADA